jgi:integrase
MAINRNSPKLLTFATQGSKLVAKSKFNFTKRAVAALPNPPKVRAYFYDTKVAGLGIAVSPLGRKVFLLYRKVGGRPERVPIGLFPDVTVEQARGRASELNGAIARGENPADSKRQVRDEMALKELFDQYGELHASEKRTWPEMQRMFRVYLHRWHLRKISAIRKLDVVALHANLKRTRGPYLANRVVELLGSMFGRAISDWGWKGTNPAAGVTPSKERKRKRFVLPEEAGAFFRALDAEPNETIRDYIYMSLFTGARRANVEAMRWAHIDWPRAVWSIPAEQAKEDEEINIPLVPPALDILRRRKQTASCEWVFAGRGSTGHLVEPKRCWQRILASAGLSDLRLHDLRRTMASWQALTGASLPVIGKSLGHAAGSPATAIYARLTDGPVRESMQKGTTALLLAGKVNKAEK